MDPRPICVPTSSSFMLSTVAASTAARLGLPPAYRRDGNAPTPLPAAAGAGLLALSAPGTPPAGADDATAAGPAAPPPLLPLGAMVAPPVAPAAPNTLMATAPPLSPPPARVPPCCGAGGTGAGAHRTPPPLTT
jgi:hypothetical protein